MERLIRSASIGCAAPQSAPPDYAAISRLAVRKESTCHRRLSVTSTSLQVSHVTCLHFSNMSVHYYLLHFQ